MSKSIDNLIAQVQAIMDNPNEFGEMKMAQIVARVNTELAAILTKNSSLLEKLPEHLKREFIRLEKEMESQKQCGNHYGILGMQSEMLRIVSIAMQLQRNAQQGRER